MQHIKDAQHCNCGCGGLTIDSIFMPGHENRVYNAIVEHVGDIQVLREVVEQYTGRPVILHVLH